MSVIDLHGFRRTSLAVRFHVAKGARYPGAASVMPRRRARGAPPVRFALRYRPSL